MRCQKPNTDQSGEVYLSSGEKIYAEYMWDPYTSNRESKPNIFESFVPVNDGEQITVNIKFRGTVLHGAADVLADGAFVYDRRIEGDKKGKVKYQKRDWKLEEFYNVPGSLDTDAMHSGTAVVAGNLIVKPLNQGDVPLYVKNGGKLGLGSIAVIISVNQDTFESYPQNYKHQTIGKWRGLHSNHADGGIKPVHELEFRMEDDEVHFNRQQRHKRHGEQTRFGLKPWAVFVFFYRPQSVIQQAGCILRPKKAMELDPFLGEFTFADPDAIVKKRLATRAKNDREKCEAAEEDEEEKNGFGYDGNDTHSNARGLSGSGGLFVSRSPSQGTVEPSKKRLFGNSPGMQSATSYAPTRDSRISEDEMATIPQGKAQPRGDWQDLFGDDAVGFHITAARPHAMNGAPTQYHNSVSGTDQGDDFAFDFYPDLPADELAGEIDQALQAGGFDAPQAPAAAPVAKMVASSPRQNRMAPSQQSGPGEVVQTTEMIRHGQHQPRPQQQPSGNLNEEEHAEPSPLAQMVSSAVQHKVNESKAAKIARIEAKAAKKERPPPAPKGKPVFDPTAKTGYGYGNPKMAPEQSMAPTREAMQQLNAQDKQMHGMLQNYLQSQSGIQQYAPSPKSSPHSMPYQRPWEIARPARSTQYAMSPPNRVAYPNVATQSVPPSPQPAQASPHAPILAIPRKRSASITSRESISSKKLRIAEIAARKAAVLAALQEKQKAKDSAARQLEEQRRAREEMERRREDEERTAREAEEAEEAELAALEAQLAGADADVETIREVGRREAEEARMRELEREREGEGEE